MGVFFKKRVVFRTAAAASRWENLLASSKALAPVLHRDRFILASSISMRASRDGKL